MTDKEYILRQFPNAEVKAYVLGHWAYKFEASQSIDTGWYIIDAESEEQVWSYMKTSFLDIMLRKLGQ